MLLSIYNNITVFDKYIPFNDDISELIWSINLQDPSRISCSSSGSGNLSYFYLALVMVADQ